MKRTGAGWQQAGGLLIVAALTGCQPERPKQQPAKAQPPPASPAAAETRPAEPVAAEVPAQAPVPAAPHQPARTQPSKSGWQLMGSPAVRRVLQVHRYVGTVGGQPATAELQWYTPDSITGRFYLHRADLEYIWASARKGKEPVVFDFGEEGQWRLSGHPGGSFLRAIWHRGRSQQSVSLREDYAGAVRYGVRRQLLVEVVDSTAGREDKLATSIERDFLMLPAPATVRPALRHLLNPGPKVRLRQLYDLEAGNSVVTHRLTVLLNGFGLFSYQACDYSKETGSTPEIGFTSTLLDLNTGRPITVDSQLQPGYELPLQRLITQHVLHGPKFDEQKRERLKNDWRNPHLAGYPDMDVGLTATGLQAVYWQPMYPAFVLIPYRELRPLVRPGTPLARMLRARGLW